MEPWVAEAWATTAAKARARDRVIAVFEDEPVGAWPVRDVFATDATYRLANDDEGPRIGLSLGDPLPMLPEYRDVPPLRRGVMDVERPAGPLAADR